MLTFKELYNDATALANCVFGSRDTKEHARSAILMTVVASCEAYEKDEEFRRKIQAYKELNR